MLVFRPTAMICRHALFGARAVYCLFRYPIVQERMNSQSASSASIDTNTKSAETEPSVGPVRNFMRSFLDGGFLKKRESKNVDVALHTSASRLYIKCANVDFLRFITTFKLSDTLESWFVITGLHLWFVLLRLRQEFDDQTDGFAQFQDAIMDVLWLDVKRRLEAISRTDHFINKKEIRAEMSRYYAYLTMSMIELDEGIMDDDKVLAGALWRLFYKSKQMEDIDVVNKLVRYVRMQVHALNQRTMDDIITTGITGWQFPDS